MRRIAQFEKLKKYIQELGSAAVAYSGGIDSAFLLKTAYDVLGSSCTAVTIKPFGYSEQAFRQSQEYARNIGVMHIIIETGQPVLGMQNRIKTDGAGLWKKNLYENVLQIASEFQIPYVMDGIDSDDFMDYKTLSKGVKNVKTVSPLRECGFARDDVRLLARQLKWSIWDKVSVPYSLDSAFMDRDSIKRKLDRIEKAENYLVGLGFREISLQHYGDGVRIEIDDEGERRLLNKALMHRIKESFLQFGFSYVTFDFGTLPVSL